MHELASESNYVLYLFLHAEHLDELHRISDRD
jgi:hypothetical protein